MIGQRLYYLVSDYVLLDWPFLTSGHRDFDIGVMYLPTLPTFSLQYFGPGLLLLSFLFYIEILHRPTVCIVSKIQSENIFLKLKGTYSNVVSSISHFYRRYTELTFGKIRDHLLHYKIQVSMLRLHIVLTEPEHIVHY